MRLQVVIHNLIFKLIQKLMSQYSKKTNLLLLKGQVSDHSPTESQDYNSSLKEKLPNSNPDAIKKIVSLLL